MRIALVAMVVCAFAQTPDYAPNQENVVFKTQIGKQINKDDVQCGDYFWKSDKADKKGTVSVYYFYGNPAYGKNRLGLYHLNQYKVVVNPAKDPPTVQVFYDGEGTLKEVRVQMTQSQYDASRVCFPN
ncbi:MAG TPA: hypothetical protein VG456_03980 [Candidatus Sulfopaludibacter sp.]|jgi:hypothetical protein|nr:hypothetical protein [Candidatus Sulfopaludibacter sp.]